MVFIFFLLLKKYATFLKNKSSIKLLFNLKEEVYCLLFRKEGGILEAKKATGALVRTGGLNFSLRGWTSGNFRYRYFATTYFQKKVMDD